MFLKVMTSPFFRNHWCAINTPLSTNIDAPHSTVDLWKWNNQILHICCIRLYSYNFWASIHHIHLQNFTVFHKVPIMVHYKIHHHKNKVRNHWGYGRLWSNLNLEVLVEALGFMTLIIGDWWMLGFLMGLAFQSLSWVCILEELLTFKSGDLGG
jgi:hypothetical protein